MHLQAARCEHGMHASKMQLGEIRGMLSATGMGDTHTVALQRAGHADAETGGHTCREDHGAVFTQVELTCRQSAWKTQMHL